MSYLLKGRVVVVQKPVLIQLYVQKDEGPSMFNIKYQINKRILSL